MAADDSGTDNKWIEKANKGISAKGSAGSFGKATPGKIAADKKKGGVMEKKAVFAQNMKKIADGNKKKTNGKRMAK